MRRDSVCNTFQEPIITSVIDVNEITACGESRFPARFLGASLAEHQGQVFEHVWATDIDRDSCRTIRGNGIVRPERVKVSDVRSLDFDALSAIDGLVFGFPCNDFSAVGERRGITGDYGDLYQFGVKALNALNPKFFVAENVSGLSSVNRNSDFKRILGELGKAGTGYKVVEHL